MYKTILPVTLDAFVGTPATKCTECYIAEGSCCGCVVLFNYCNLINIKNILLLNLSHKTFPMCALVYIIPGFKL